MLSSKISKFIFRKAFLFAITFLVVLSAISLAAFTNILVGEDRPQLGSGINTSRGEKVHDFINSWKIDSTSLETPGALIVNGNLQVRGGSPAAGKVLQATDSSGNLIRATADTGSLGATGNGIDYIETGTKVGLITPYTIHYTNGNTWTYYVKDGENGSNGPQGPIGTGGTAGANGATGNGISSIDLIATGLVDTYRIQYTNGSRYDYYVTNGIKLESGTTNAIPVRRNNTLQISGTDMFNSAGNIGIGFENPANKLSVNGAINAASDINTDTTYKIGLVDYGQYFINTGGTSGQVRVSNGTGRGQRKDTTGDNLGNHTATQNINLGNKKIYGQSDTNKFIVLTNDAMLISNDLNIRKGSPFGSNPLLIQIQNYKTLFKGATDGKVSIGGDTIDTDYQATINGDTRIQGSLLGGDMSANTNGDIKLENGKFTTYLNKYKDEVNQGMKHFGLIIDRQDTDAPGIIGIGIKVIMDTLDDIAAIFMGRVGIKVTSPQVTLDVGGSIKISKEDSTTCNNTNKGEIRFDGACFMGCTYSGRQSLHTCNPSLSCGPNNGQTFDNLTGGNTNNCTGQYANTSGFVAYSGGRSWNCIDNRGGPETASCNARATQPSCGLYAGSGMENLSFPEFGVPNANFCNPGTFENGSYNSGNNYRYRGCSKNGQSVGCYSPHIIDGRCSTTANTCEEGTYEYVSCLDNTASRNCNGINGGADDDLCEAVYTCNQT